MTNLWKNVAVKAGEKWIDWEGYILLTEYGKKGTKVGRNFTYKTIAVKTGAPLGSFIKVKVEKCGVGYLTGVEI